MGDGSPAGSAGGSADGGAQQEQQRRSFEVVGGGPVHPRHLRAVVQGGDGPASCAAGTVSVSPARAATVSIRSVSRR